MSELQDDVESDLSVFHRIEEMEAMPSPRFLRLACRLPAYAGAVAARLRVRAESAASVPGTVGTPQAQGEFHQGPRPALWSRATSGGAG